MPTTSSRDSGLRAASTIATLALVLFLVPGAAYAQDAGGAPAGQESLGKGSGREIVSYVPKTSVTNSATGQSMDSPLSPLHLGRLSLLSFESLYLYDKHYNFLQPDYQTGNLTKNPYLGTNRRYLENNLGATLEHPLSARTSLAFDFRYQYIRTVVGPNDINVAPDPSFKSVQSVQSLAAGFGWSHAFSATQGMQIRYGYDHRLYSTGGIADLHSLLFNYNC